MEFLKTKNDKYFIFPNGLKICWGYTYANTFDNASVMHRSISLPIQFTNAPYVTCTKQTNAKYRNGTIDLSVNIGAYPTTTSVAFYFNNKTGNFNEECASQDYFGCYWIAIGY